MLNEKLEDNFDMHAIYDCDRAEQATETTFKVQIHFDVFDAHKLHSFSSVLNS